MRDSILRNFARSRIHAQRLRQAVRGRRSPPTSAGSTILSKDDRLLLLCLSLPVLLVFLLLSPLGHASPIAFASAWVISQSAMPERDGITLRTRLMRRSALVKVPSFSRKVEPGRNTWA